MRHITRIAVAAATFTFALALAVPAEAHDRRDNRHRIEQRHRHHKQHKRFDRYDKRTDRHHREDYRRFERRYRHDRFDIPRHIRHQRRHEYRPFFEGTVYFAPHRHRHSVYLFPVRVGRGWSYREHYYCNDDLFLDFGRVEYHGRRFSISIGR